MINAPAFVKIAVVRGPVQRVVSAFMNKFVVARHNGSTHRHSTPVYGWLAKQLGCEWEDIFDRITFADFVRYPNHCKNGLAGDFLQVIACKAGSCMGARGSNPGFIPANHFRLQLYPGSVSYCRLAIRDFLQLSG